MPKAAPAVFYHQLFDLHEIVLANGALAESLLIADRADAFLSAEPKKLLPRQFPQIEAHPLARRQIRGKKAKSLFQRPIKTARAVLSTWQGRI